MKVTVNEKPKEEEKEYPYIAKEKNKFTYFILLFIKENTAIVLYRENPSLKIGKIDSFDERNWELFTGEIVLSNS